MRSGLDNETLKHIYERLAGRYDWQHALLTAGADRRGRKLLVEVAVQAEDKVLDCGSGTGSTGILAVHKVGPSGRVLFQRTLGVPLWPFLVFIVKKAGPATPES